MARKRPEICFCCGIPTTAAQSHHVFPRSYPGAPKFCVYLCNSCHDLLDRRRFQEPMDRHYLWDEATKTRGERWARLMLLEYYKIITQVAFEPEKASREAKNILKLFEKTLD